MQALLEFPRNLTATSPYHGQQPRDRSAASEGHSQGALGSERVHKERVKDIATGNTMVTGEHCRQQERVNATVPDGADAADGAGANQNVATAVPAATAAGTGIPPTPISQQQITTIATSQQISNPSSQSKGQQSEQMVSATLWLENALAEFAKSKAEIKKLANDDKNNEQGMTSHSIPPPIQESEKLLKACIKQMVVHLGLRAAHAAVEAIKFSELRWSTSPPPLPSFHLPAYAVQSEMNAGNLDPNTMLYPAPRLNSNINAAGANDKQGDTTSVQEPQTAENITHQLLRLLNEAQVARIHAEEKSRDSGIPLFATDESVGMETGGPNSHEGQQALVEYRSPQPHSAHVPSPQIMADPFETNCKTLQSPTSAAEMDFDGSGRLNSLFPIGSLPALQDDLIDDQTFFKSHHNLQADFLQTDPDQFLFLETPILQWTPAVGIGAGHDDYHLRTSPGTGMDRDALAFGSADEPWTVGVTSELGEGDGEGKAQEEKGKEAGNASVEKDYAKEVVLSIKSQRKALGLCDKHLHCTRRAVHRGQCRLAADAYRALIEAAGGMGSRPRPRGTALCSPKLGLWSTEGRYDGIERSDDGALNITSDTKRPGKRKGKSKTPRMKRTKNDDGDGEEDRDEERSDVTVEDLNDRRAMTGNNQDYCEKSALCHNVRGHRGRCSKGTIRWDETVSSLCPSRRLHQEFMACFYIWTHTLTQETCSKGMPLTEWKALKAVHTRQLEILDVGMLDARAESCELSWSEKSVVGFHLPQCFATTVQDRREDLTSCEAVINIFDQGREHFGHNLDSLLTNITSSYSIAALPFPIISNNKLEQGGGSDIGVFATRRVAQGELIMELIGEWVTVDEATQRASKYLEQPTTPGSGDTHAGVDTRVPDYVCGHVPKSKQVCGDRYMVHVSDHLVLDATCAGSVARFINHSNKPTATMYAVPTTGDYLLRPNAERVPPRIFVIASSELRIGQEITIDYFSLTI